jgi:hypothetical protein
VIESDALDRALVLLVPYGPSFGGGLSNHAPMVAEAIVHVGRADALDALMRTQTAWLEPAPPPGRPIAPADQAIARGIEARYADWYATTSAALANAPLNDVLRRLLPALGDGIYAELAHGAIRTAHAVRALEAQTTPARVDELARGLAYWSAGYERVLGVAALDGPATIADSFAALAALPVVLVPTFAARRPAIDTTPAFAAALAGLGVASDAPVEAIIDELLLHTARALVANPNGAVIFLVHGFTGTAATRILVPYLEPAAARAAAAAAWETIGATIFLCEARPDPRRDPYAGPEPAAWGDLVEQAIASGDEHAIKFAVAASDADARRSDPIYRIAAQAVITRFGG